MNNMVSVIKSVIFVAACLLTCRQTEARLNFVQTYVADCLNLQDVVVEETSAAETMRMIFDLCKQCCYNERALPFGVTSAGVCKCEKPDDQKPAMIKAAPVDEEMDEMEEMQDNFSTGSSGLGVAEFESGDESDGVDKPMK